MTFQEALAVPTRAKLRVKDFLLLHEAGAFADGSRTELLDGEVWVLNALHMPHARAHAALMVEMGIALRAAGSALILFDALSTDLSEFSMPQPDIVLGEHTEERVFSGKLLRLAVEVADTTLRMDMGVKARLYAEAGVPEYWVLDVGARMIHQMWSPREGRFAERRDLPVADGITAATIPGLVLSGFSIG